MTANSLSRTSNRNQNQKVPGKSYYALNRCGRNTQWQEWKRTLYQQCPARLADRLLAALDRFNKYKWNISTTSRETGIPLSTLFRHQAELRYYGFTRPVTASTSSFVVSQKREPHKELRYSNPQEDCDSVEAVSTLDSSIQPETAPAETKPPKKPIPEKAKPTPPVPLPEEFWKFCELVRPLFLRCADPRPLYTASARELWELAASKLPPHYALNHLQLYKFLDKRMTPRRRAIESPFHYAHTCIRNDWPIPRKHWHANKPLPPPEQPPPALPPVPHPQPLPPAIPRPQTSATEPVMPPAPPPSSYAPVHETLSPVTFRRTTGGFTRLRPLRSIPSGTAAPPSIPFTFERRLARQRERRFQAQARQLIAEHFRQDKPHQEPDG